MLRSVVTALLGMKDNTKKIAIFSMFKEPVSCLFHPPGCVLIAVMLLALCAALQLFSIK
jgi:hypothetical protein